MGDGNGIHDATPAIRKGGGVKRLENFGDFIYAGPSLAWVQGVHLHPRFLRNLIIVHMICTHKSTYKLILGIQVEICTHALQILTTAMHIMDGPK